MTCLEELERFLPYIDNWATCDMLAVKVVKKHLDTFIDEVYRWMESRPCIYHPVRYQYADALLSGRCISDGVPGESGTDPFGRILCKYDACMVFLRRRLQSSMIRFSRLSKSKKLDVWTHNKTIQKAIESYRITPEQKEYLRGLKIKK